ncbi:MAG: EAL domain-containing protein [bacterium]|nr:EAL domain-containing protein [bacterium]
MTQAFRLLPRGYLREENSMSIGVLGDLELQSSYQVIISPALLRSVGMEAQLLVQHAGAPESLASVLARLPDKDMADLDRLALTVHARNAPATPYGNEWLFLPIHPQTIRQRLFAPEKVLSELAALNVSPERIVLEITESATLEDAELEEFVSMYRECGFRIAIDDFGAGASNYDRILSLRPNIVRLDPSLIQNAEHSARAARLFPHMVSLLRESGSLVLVDGITSETQARIAVDADAELLQGDWFAPAAGILPPADAIREKSALLMGAGKLAPDRTELRMRSRFMAVWNGYRDGRELDDIVSDIPDAEITRVYVIDNNGYQIGDTALTPHAMRGRGHPLSDARGACWARRQYFRNAVEQPGRVQITRPYLSLTEQRLCVTFSCVVMRPGLGQVVLCMDALIN